MFDTGKTRMIGLPYGVKNYDDMLSRFHTIPACYGQTDRQTDRQNCYRISISRVSTLMTRDKKQSIWIKFLDYIDKGPECSFYSLVLQKVVFWLNILC